MSPTKSLYGPLDLEHSSSITFPLGLYSSSTVSVTAEKTSTQLSIAFLLAHCRARPAANIAYPLAHCGAQLAATIAYPLAHCGAQHAAPNTTYLIPYILLTNIPEHSWSFYLSNITS